MSTRTAVALLAINTVTTLALIAACGLWWAPVRTPRLAVLDVAELYRLKEREVAAVLVKHDASHEDRIAALGRASAFGAAITTLLERLPAECGCLILARGALVGPAERLPDLTPLARERLGL